MSKPDDHLEQTPWEAALGIIESLRNVPDPSVAFFDDAEARRIFAALRTSDPAHYAQVKRMLKELKINLNDVERTLNAERLHLVVEGETGPGIPDLLENETGYLKQNQTEAGLEPQPISNFLINIVEYLEMPNGEEVVVADVRIEGGPPRRYHLPHTAFLKRETLQRALNTIVTQWDGTDRDIQLLRGHLLRQNAPRKRGVKVMGRHSA